MINSDLKVEGMSTGTPHHRAVITRVFDIRSTSIVRSPEDIKNQKTNG
jgi:hypothetical protein